MAGAVIDDGALVGALDADHLKELGLVQGKGFLFGQALGVVIVLLSALDDGQAHAGIERVVLVVVENPLQSGGPVIGDHVRLVVAVHVNPGHVVAQMEGPGLAAVLSAPGLGGAGLQLAVVVKLKQVDDQVADDVVLGRALGVGTEQGGQLAGVGEHQILDLLACVGLGRSGGIIGVAVGSCGVAGGIGIRGVGAGVGVSSACDQSQRHDRRQKHCKKPLVRFHLRTSSIFG